MGRHVQAGSKQKRCAECHVPKAKQEGMQEDMIDRGGGVCRYCMRRHVAWGRFQSLLPSQPQSPETYTYTQRHSPKVQFLSVVHAGAAMPKFQPFQVFQTTPASKASGRKRRFHHPPPPTCLQVLHLPAPPSGKGEAGRQAGRSMEAVEGKAAGWGGGVGCGMYVWKI